MATCLSAYIFLSEATRHMCTTRRTAMLTDLFKKVVDRLVIPSCCGALLARYTGLHSCAGQGACGPHQAKVGQPLLHMPGPAVGPSCHHAQKLRSINSPSAHRDQHRGKICRSRMITRLLDACDVHRLPHRLLQHEAALHFQFQRVICMELDVL